MSTLIFPYILSLCAFLSIRNAIISFSSQYSRVNISEIILPTMCRAWGQEKEIDTYIMRNFPSLSITCVQSHMIARACVWEVRRVCTKILEEALQVHLAHMWCAERADWFGVFAFVVLCFWLYWAFVALFRLSQAEAALVAARAGFSCGGFPRVWSTGFSLGEEQASLGVRNRASLGVEHGFPSVWSMRFPRCEHGLPHSVWSTGFSWKEEHGLLLVWSTGSAAQGLQQLWFLKLQSPGSIAVVLGLSCSAGCGGLPGPGTEPRLLH